MTLRADHVAGAAFVGFGALVFALSGDLPIGQLSMPGSGFMPKILAGLTDPVRHRADRCAARESRPFAESLLERRQARRARWSLITAAAIALFDWLGFLITMMLLMFALLVVIERRNVLCAGRLYSLGVIVAHLCRRSSTC